MDRRQELHFSSVPTANISRSRFKMPNDLTTTFNSGDLVPIFCMETVPGDTIKLTGKALIRMTTLLDPIMTPLFCDMYFFYVPFRLVWDNYKYFEGEQKTDPFRDPTTYTIPQVKIPEAGYELGTIANYFGIPIGQGKNLEISALPFRSYALICNEWFRDENLQTPINIPRGDELTEGSNGDDYVTDLVKGGKCFVASKYHDYFTSALPEPQRGDPVLLPLGEITHSETHLDTADEAYNFASGNRIKLNAKDLGTMQPNKVYNLGFGTQTTSAINNIMVVDKSQVRDLSDTHGVIGSNLIVSGTGTISSTATINDLRLAFQTQKALERASRSGSRYKEWLSSAFGVNIPDIVVSRPEYLGSHRFDINVNQVLNTTSSGSTPQGDTTAYSLSVDSHKYFNKSFSERGYIIGLACVRYLHSYSQGIDKMFFRKNKFDFYDPIFANIGEQPIFNKEIFVQDNGNVQNDEVFGYNEAWADYRFRHNRTTGEMSPTAPQPLSSWHLGDFYNSLPTLGSSWIREDKNNVDRVVTVTSQNSHQFKGDFYFDVTAIRPMPVFSVPGLIDHH